MEQWHLKVPWTFTHEALPQVKSAWSHSFLSEQSKTVQWILKFQDCTQLDFNKRHEVSLRPSCWLHYHLWRELWTIKVIKCLPSSSAQGDVNSNPKQLPEHNSPPPQPKSQRGGLCFVTFITKLTIHVITCISKHECENHSECKPRISTCMERTTSI